MREILLDRYALIELLIDRQIGDAESALTQHGKDPVSSSDNGTGRKMMRLKRYDVADMTVRTYRDIALISFAIITNHK